MSFNLGGGGVGSGSGGNGCGWKCWIVLKRI